MLESYQAKHCYSIALNTIAQSLDASKATKAYELLDSMRAKNYHFGWREYAAVLSACTSTGTLESAMNEDKHAAFRVACKSFHAYVEGGSQPHKMVYQEIIRAHGTLLEANETREELVAALFKNAPLSIQSSPEVRKTLQSTISDAAYQQLVE